MKRVCRKDGHVIVADPEFFFSFMHRLMERIEPGNAGMHNTSEMRKLFEKVGLKVTYQKRIGLIAVVSEGKK